MKRKQGSYAIIGEGKHFEIYMAGRYLRNKRGAIRVFSSLRSARNAANATVRAAKAGGMTVAEHKAANDAAYAAHQAAERAAQEAMDAEAMALHRRAGKRELERLAKASAAAQALADEAEAAFFKARAAWAAAQEAK